MSTPLTDDVRIQAFIKAFSAIATPRVKLLVEMYRYINDSHWKYYMRIVDGVTNFPDINWEIMINQGLAKALLWLYPKDKKGGLISTTRFDFVQMHEVFTALRLIPSINEDNDSLEEDILYFLKFIPSDRKCYSIRLRTILPTPYMKDCESMFTQFEMSSIRNFTQVFDSHMEYLYDINQSLNLLLEGCSTEEQLAHFLPEVHPPSAPLGTLDKAASLINAALTEVNPDVK